MTIRFRALIVLSALAGLAAAQAPRAAADDQKWDQCWPRPGIEPPGMCSTCAYDCFGSDYICCPVLPSVE